MDEARLVARTAATHYVSATKGPVAIATMNAMHIANAIRRLERAGRTSDPAYAALVKERDGRGNKTPVPEPALDRQAVDGLARLPVGVRLDRRQSNEGPSAPVSTRLERSGSSDILNSPPSASIERSPLAQPGPPSASIERSRSADLARATSPIQVERSVMVRPNHDARQRQSIRFVKR